MKNNKIAMIYTYLVNYVKDDDINDLIEYLRDYTINGSMQDYEELNQYLEDFEDFLGNIENKER